MSSEKLKTRPILSAATISLFLTALLCPIYSSNVEAHTGRLSHPSIFSSHEFPNSQYHPLRSSSFHNSSHPVSLPGDDKDDYVHPIFICFFVFYFFGFSLVFCYAIHLLGSKFGKWYRNYRTKRKQQSNSNEYYSTIRNRSHSNQSGRMDMVTLSSEQQHHTTIANHTISNNYLYPNNQSNHSLQYLFYIQIVPYFLIRFLIYFLIGFELIPKDYFDIENNWAHSQIFLVAFSLSGILLHNSYFLIAFFWSELESVKRGIPTRQIKPLLIFITCSLIWFGAEIAMAILVFVKCYPNLYSPSSNTVWFTWIVRIEHVLNAILSISLLIWFIIYSTYKKKSMWNLNFDEGLKYLKRKSLTQKNKRMMNHLQNDTSSGGGAHGAHGGGTIGQDDDDDTKHPHVMDETSHLLVSKSNHTTTTTTWMENRPHTGIYNTPKTFSMMTSTNTTITTTPPHAHSHNNNNNNNTNNTNNNNIEETPPQFLHSQNSSTYLGHDLTTNHNNNNNNNTNGPHLIHRIEKTKKWLYRSMIVCILVYLLQSTSQLIFTEIFIACHSNDQTYGSGVLILYNSYIIVIGFINSLSDFTPFLMCYIFHKSNEIVKDIVKDHYMSGGGGAGAGAGFGHYDFTTMTESSYNVLTGDVLNSQQILTDDATSLRNGEETEDDELPIHHPFMQQQQQHSMVVHALPHGTTMLYGSNDHDHHAVSTTNHHHHLPLLFSRPELFSQQQQPQHDLIDESQIKRKSVTSVQSTPCSTTTTDMSLPTNSTSQLQQHPLGTNQNGFFSKLFKKWRGDDEMLVQVPYKD